MNLQCSTFILILRRRKISLIGSGTGTCPSHTASKRRSWDLSPGVYSSLCLWLHSRRQQVTDVASGSAQSLPSSRTLVSPDPRCLLCKTGINSTDFTCMVGKWVAVLERSLPVKGFATTRAYHCYFYLSFLGLSFLHLKMKGWDQMLPKVPFLALH